MKTGQQMEQRLWDYIDGKSGPEERSVIEDLVATNIEWRDKHNELLEVHLLLQGSDLEQPSMRFTKNVMEEIAKYHIAPATKNYINNRVVWGIGIFFILMVVGFVIYGFSLVDWSADTGTSSIPVDIGKIDFNKFLNNTWVNVFMMINVVLGLVLLDRWLSNKKRSYQKEA